MERNVGRTDRILRIVSGLVLILAPLMNMPPIWASSWLSFGSICVGGILALTAYFGVCPIYSILGVRTRKIP